VCEVGTYPRRRKRKSFRENSDFLASFLAGFGYNHAVFGWDIELFVWTLGGFWWQKFWEILLVERILEEMTLS
jgi:hypothetical protein